MAQEYRQHFDENGNVTDPSFFTDGMSELAGQFNGGLDRDNFAEGDIESGDIATGGVRPFNMIYTLTGAVTPVLDKTVTDWQAGIAGATWTAAQDAHYDVHASIGWSWDGDWSHDVNEDGDDAIRPTRADFFDTILIRITVDGETICTAGPFDDTADRWSTYLCGAVQLPAGRHTMQFEALVVRRVVQTGELDGPCINAVTIGNYSGLILERKR